MNRIPIILGAALLLGAVNTARAQHHHGDFQVASTAPAGGNLAVEYDFDTVVGLDFDPTLTGVLPPGFSGYTSTDPGFETPEADEPAESLYRLPAGTTVTFEITAIDDGKVAIFLNGTLLDAVGESVVLGTQDATPPGDLHHHGEMRLILMLPADQPGEGSFSFKLTAPGFGDSESYSVKLSNTHLFVDYAAGDPKTNLKCQKAIGKNVAKFLGGYAKTLGRCLDKVAAVVAAEEQELPPESAEAAAAEACGDLGGTLPAPATLSGRLDKVKQKAADGIAKACGAAFDVDKVARHLNQAACGVQFIGAQGYAEAHTVIAEVTEGDLSPVLDVLPCLVPTAAGEGEAPS